MKNRQTTYRTCADFPAATVAHLMEMPATDEARRRWEIHSENCSFCRNILEMDRELVTGLRNIPDPAPVYVRAAVMSQIRGKRSRLFRRGDFAWGASAAFAGIALGMVLVWNGISPIQTTVATDTGNEMASLTVADDFDTFAADLALSQ